MPESDIGGLLRGTAAGDRRSFARLYDETSPYVFGILLRMLADRERAEEVAQEVYLQAWRTAGSFDERRGSGWTWLAMMTRSRALDRIRADRSYGRALERLEADPAGADPNPGPDSDRETAMGNLRERARAALNALPEEQAQALRLAFFGGLSHREIAERTGIPLGTVKTRIRTALTKLREALA
ncbi:MAG TPA: sigma-70 family RNA polymerase sigma factor [Gemmatimonadota bacterium]|nr:sigma-70 family RNA polymerase sigma factor [Gemmatimonadota bacterium]